MQAAIQKNFGRTRLWSLTSFGRQSPPAENSKNVFLTCPVHRPNRNLIVLALLIFSAFITIVSCATVSTSPIYEDTQNDAQYNALFPGVEYIHEKLTSPRIEYHALRIDLSSPEIEIVVRGGADNGTTNTRVSSFVRDNNLIAGINALPFDVSSSREGLPIKNIGIVVSNGELLSAANNHYDALVFYKDGRAAIVRQSSISLTRSLENIQNAVGGFHSILISGEPAPRTLSSEGAAAARHPRSAAGISADNRYLILLVIDGRRSGSIGATEQETALLLRSLGSYDGINFDGGGSSALAMRIPDGSVKVVNMPVHNGIPGWERAVAGCIGIGVNPSMER
ncbi:MAG: phosphodiester glycosidase family protein [Treponema sp.]|nr:phosphodiester glycosidase family protein [Treponema sp.]